MFTTDTHFKIMPLSDAWIDGLAGWCSGAVSVGAVQPVDTILTRWQAAKMPVVTATTVTASSSPTSALSLARTFTHSAGWSALWRGASPMITAVPLQNALLMGGYGVGTKYSELYAPHARYTSIFVGGLVGGIVQSFLMSPVELLKVTQQCRNQTVVRAGQTLLQQVMPSSIVWRGLGATLLRDGIPHGVWFVSYEWCKIELEKMMVHPLERQPDGLGGDSTITTITTTTTSTVSSVFIPLVSGAVAATVAWVVGYPADLIKTRIQHASSSTTHPAGIVETAQQLIAEANGRVLAGLYRGLGLKLVRAVPASMIGFSVYEMVKKQVLERF